MIRAGLPVPGEQSWPVPAVVSLASPHSTRTALRKGVRMDQAFPGWRARIGVIYPASGLADMEYYRLCPSGVSVHLTRSSVPNDGGVTLADVLEVAEGRQFTQLAEDLATVRPHAAGLDVHFW